MAITLEKIDNEKFYEVIKMKLPPEQDNYVADNLYSLAEAWLYPDEARPYAVCCDGKPVGFLMFSWDEKERGAGIWRFMIAPEHQKKGYGKKAMELAVQMAREAKDIDFMFLDYVEGNTVARDMYYAFGFRETGKVEQGEIVMKMNLTDRPKIGALIADEEDAVDITALFDGRPVVGDLDVAKEQDIAGLIEAEKLVRLTLFGETVGIATGDKLLLDKEYEEYLKSATEAFDALKTAL